VQNSKKTVQKVRKKIYERRSLSDDYTLKVLPKKSKKAQKKGARRHPSKK
jgi:hypothetical protein